MSDEREQPKQAAWELAELVPPHASEDVPWDRPADIIWPEPELDDLTWNERWNEAAYDPDYPLPPVVGRTPARQAVAAGTASPSSLRFGRPLRPPDDMESDDPYDEYAPLADDLDAPGQLTWTGGAASLRPVASADATDPTQPATVEPPTWSPTSRSVFGDYFAGSPGNGARPLPSPDPESGPAVERTASDPDPAPTAAEEWPPIPTDFPPQWASVAPVQPAWSQAPRSTQPAAAKPATVSSGSPAWVQSTLPGMTAERRPAPPVRATPSRPQASYIVTPPLTSATVRGGAAGAILPAATPLPTVRPVIPPRVAPRPAAPILPDDYGDRTADAANDEEDSESEGSGPSTVSTLFWMAVTGVVVVGLVLAFLHFMTGVLR